MLRALPLAVLLMSHAFAAAITVTSSCSDGPTNNLVNDSLCQGPLTSAEALATPSVPSVSANATFSGQGRDSGLASARSTLDTDYLLTVSGTGTVLARACLSIERVWDPGARGSSGDAVASLGSVVLRMNGAGSIDNCALGSSGGNLFQVTAGVPTVVHLTLMAFAAAGNEDSRPTLGRGFAKFGGLSLVDTSGNPIGRAFTFTELPEPGTLPLLLVGTAVAFTVAKFRRAKSVPRQI